MFKRREHTVPPPYLERGRREGARVRDREREGVCVRERCEGG